MNLEEIDNKVFEIWKKIFKLKYINPVNQEEEKEKFMNSQDYNPQFKFLELDFNPDEYLKQLEELKANLDTSPIAELLSEKIDKLVIWLNMLKTRGTEKFSGYSVDYYGKPDLELTAKALDLIKKETNEKEEEKTLTAEQIAEHLKEKVNEMGLEWDVKVRENLGARADDVTAEETLYIKEGEMFSKKDLKRLTIHELGVHSTRAFNAKKLKYKIFLVGTAEYETTEEGLATVVEEKEGILEDSILKSYAGRVIAIGMALQKSFREVYDYLSNHFSKDEAYQLTMRVKRGIADTSQPGAFTKDHIYLKGRELLKQVTDIEPLFKGRISVQDLLILERLEV